MQQLCVQLHCTLYTVLNYIVHCTTFFIVFMIYLSGSSVDISCSPITTEMLPSFSHCHEKTGEIYNKTSNTWHWMMKDPGHFLWPNSDGHGLWTMESGLCCVMKQCAAVTTQLSAIKVPAHPPWYRQGGIFVAGSLSQKRKKERNKQTNKQTNKVEMFSASVSPL